MIKKESKTECLLVLAATIAGFLLLAGMRAGDPFDGFLAFNEGWYAMIAQNYSHHSLLEPTVWEGQTDLNVPPLYSWAPVASAATFKITITNVLNINVFDATSRRPYLAYPENAPALFPGGWYLCRVAAFDGDNQRVGDEAFGISILDAKSHQAFRREESTLRAIAEKGKGNSDAYFLLGNFTRATI